MTKQQAITLSGMGLVIALIIGYTLYSQANPLPSGSSSPDSISNDSYTMEKIAEHKDASSCWTTIDGNVYDLTSWISLHPGGKDAIMLICGKDGNAAFHEQHDGQPQPADVLAAYKIGTLAR